MQKRQLQGAMDDVRDAKRQLTTMLDQVSVVQLPWDSKRI